MQTRLKPGAARRVPARQMNVPSAAGTVLSATILAAVTMAALVGAAAAQEASVPGYDRFSYSYERLAFDAADTDGDGLVSEAELARDAAEPFEGLRQPVLHFIGHFVLGELSIAVLIQPGKKRTRFWTPFGSAGAT